MPFVNKQTAALLEGGNYGAPTKRMPKSDVALVFPYKTAAIVKWGEAQEEEGTRGLRPPTEAERHKMETWQVRRKGAIAALSDCGLVLFPYYSRDRDEIVVRIAAEEDHLRKVAEMIRLRLELKPQYLSAFAEFKSDFAGRREISYRDRKVVSHLYKTHVDITDKDQGQRYPRPGDIFRTTDRIQLIDYIIRSSDHHCANCDVGQMMHDKDVNHYFPLHENAKLRMIDKDWFNAFAWGNSVDKVRDYFGERVGMYFLFMSHLNKWLVMPAIIGVLLLIWDWTKGTPNNKTGFIVSIGMGLWCSLFIPFWRRQAAFTAAKWGTLGMGPQLEPTRPEFIGVSQINPVTGRLDRFYPWSQRFFKVLFSFSVLSVTLVCLGFCVMCLFALRHVFADRPNGRITFQIINAVAVEIINGCFTVVAKWLTDRENHRAYSEYANHLLAKTVVFKFVNCYCSLYYIAFFKAHSYLFGMQMSCVNNDCMNDLGQQLAIFMISRLTLQNLVELGLPYVLMAWRSFREGHAFHNGLFTNASTVMPDLSVAERQSKKELYDPHEDMDEILMLYGYTTLFVVACPWVPALALFSSILECFLDEKKLVMLYRRPFPSPAANNEPWDTAFDVFGMLAMLTNTLVIIFSSDALDGWSHTEKLMLFLAIEHALVFTRIIVGLIYPAMPRRVKLLLMQQQVILHKHVNLGGEVDDTEARASAMMTAAALPPYVYDGDNEDEEY